MARPMRRGKGHARTLLYSVFFCAWLPQTCSTEYDTEGLHDIDPNSLSFSALLEAQDVEIYLKPLRRHIEHLQEAGFSQSRPCIPPLFHTIHLIWNHSKCYNTPARVIVLLQEFCNLFIDQV